MRDSSPIRNTTPPSRSSVAELLQERHVEDLDVPSRGRLSCQRLRKRRARNRSPQKRVELRVTPGVQGLASVVKVKREGPHGNVGVANPAANPTTADLALEVREASRDLFGQRGSDERLVRLRG